MKAKDMGVLFEELAGLAHSGAPLGEGLAEAARDVSSSALSDTMERLSVRLNKGRPLSHALVETIPDFPPYYSSILVAGEKSGTLADALDDCLNEQTRLQAYRANIMELLIYPGLLVSVAFVIFILIVNLVLPGFAEIYSDLGAELPGITAAILKIQWVVSPLGLWGLAAMLVAAFFFMVFIPAGQSALEWVFGGAPGFRDLIHTYYAGQSMRVVAKMVHAGETVQEAAKVAAPVLSLTRARNQLDQLSQHLGRGKRLGESLSAVRLISPFHARTLERAEQRGHLGDALELIADEYERRHQRLRSIALIAFEPFVLLLIGSMIGIIIMAVYLPLFSLPENIH